MSLSNATLKRVAKAQNGVPLHVHVAEALDDELDSEEKYKKPIIKRFDDFGLLVPNSLIVHGVHLKDEEQEVKNNLMILLLSEKNAPKEDFSYEKVFDSMSAWADDGKTAEEEIKEIYSSRTQGETRKIMGI